MIPLTFIISNELQNKTYKYESLVDVHKSYNPGAKLHHCHLTDVVNIIFLQYHQYQTFQISTSV